MIPVSIITGFLGSGKTTLISRLLCHPACAGAAVIVNEWGEIGLDHELIATVDETVMTLATGCLCCRVQNDLAATLLELERRRCAGLIAAYQRVLIETSGLADPAPILQTLMNGDVACGHAVDSVLTLIDAVHGAATLQRYAEARRQVAVADRLLLTKTDLGIPGEPLHAQLRTLNPTAAVTATGDIADLFGAADPGARAARLSCLTVMAGPPFVRGMHTDGITCTTVERDQPVPALALAMWLRSLTEHAGDKLLRMKGLVDVAEMTAGPAVIHAVRHVVAEPVWMDRWPGERRTRIVIIGQGMPQHFPARLLGVIEEEVLEETTRHHAQEIRAARPD
jgi:G3E family GTPase